MAADKGKITLDLNTPGKQVKRKRGMMSAAPSTPIACQPLMSAASMPMRGVVVSPPLPRVVSQAPPAFNLSPSAETSVQGRGRGRSLGSQNSQMLGSMSEFFYLAS